MKNERETTEIKRFSRRAFLWGTIVTAAVAYEATSPKKVLAATLNVMPYTQMSTIEPPQLPPEPAPTTETVKLPETPQEKLQRYQEEFEQVIVPVFEKNQEVISGLRPGGALWDLKTLREYYPIYRTAEEKFGVSWFLLWLIHDAESTCSKNLDAFGPGRVNYGAMQRAQRDHPLNEVLETSTGFEDLADLPQYHPDDWREILWAASYIDGHANSWQENNSDKTREAALEYVLIYKYSAVGEGLLRAPKLRRLQEIFG